MDRYVRDAKVAGYEQLMPAVQLPDPGDAHIVAVAIHCRASTIVTLKLRDFPADVLAQFGIEAQHSDDLVVGLFNLNQVQVLRAMGGHWRSFRNPSKSAYEYLDTLVSQGLTQTVSVIRPSVAAI